MVLNHHTLLEGRRKPEDKDVGNRSPRYSVRTAWLPCIFRKFPTFSNTRKSETLLISILYGRVAYYDFTSMLQSYGLFRYIGTEWCKKVSKSQNTRWLSNFTPPSTIFLKTQETTDYSLLIHESARASVALPETTSSRLRWIHNVKSCSPKNPLLLMTEVFFLLSPNFLPFYFVD